MRSLGFQYNEIIPQREKVQSAQGFKTFAVTTEDEDDGTLRHFVVKREFAEGAIMMSMLKFPAHALPPPGEPAHVMYRCMSFASGRDNVHPHVATVTASSACIRVDQSLDGDGQVPRAARASCPVNCPEKGGRWSRELYTSAGSSSDVKLYCVQKECPHQLALPWGTRHLISPELAEKM